MSRFNYTGAEKVYHKDVFLPATLDMPQGRWPLDWSSHALQGLADEALAHGFIKPLDSLPTDKALAVEVAAVGNEVKRVVYRWTLKGGTKDLVIAVIPQHGRMAVKTAWINLTSDRHKTLDASKYAQKEG